MKQKPSFECEEFKVSLLMYCRYCWSACWLNLQVDELRGEGHNIYHPQMQKQEVPNPAKQCLASSWHTGFLNSQALPYAMMFLKKFTLTISRNTVTKWQWIKTGGEGGNRPKNNKKAPEPTIPKFSQNILLLVYSIVRKKGGGEGSTRCDMEKVLL